MGIKCETPKYGVKAAREAEIANYTRRVTRTLKYIGEQCVNEAKSGKTKIKDFIDHTNNLRSSIGYVIAKDGEIIYKTFTETGNGKEGSGEKGKKEGQALAESIAKKTKGFCLVVVAGMSYAVYVKNKGFDVIDSAELLANKITPQLLKQLEI